MPQDMSQFLQVFFEETEEHLATLELLLIGLDLDRPDSETLHGIFRAAHSIKGSSGMFGFDDITAVTHELETLLDRIRCGQMHLRPDMISSFLEARDVLQRLLDAHRSGRPDPGVPWLETVERLRGWLRVPEQEAAEEGFGLFDDAPASPARETADDDAFGFFDEGPGAPERAAAPEAFGLFDEAPGAPAASEAFGLFDEAPGSPPAEERAFGLFDGAPGSPAAPSAPAQAVAATARGAVAPVRGDGESGSIRVSVEKIDSLINLVGELVITQAMLGQLGEQLDPSRHERLQHALAQLEHNTRDLQESVMSIRMLPINFIFSRFPRLVRDTATRLGKQVELHLHGEHTELDKSVIEKLSDPLTHIVRNSIDHGIETPAERLAAGKPASGTVKLAASHQGGSVVVEVSDDGRGLSRPRILAKARERNLPVHDGMSDAEVWQLVFMPGFSTAEAVTELSGRGVGMDVVKTKISQLNGTVNVFSQKGSGSKIVIKVPLTLAIMPTLMVMLGSQAFAFPLVNVNEIFHLDLSRTNVVDGQEVVIVRDKALPLFYLKRWLVPSAAHEEQGEGHGVILSVGTQRIGFVVDQLVGQEEVVIKPLGKMLQGTPGMAGATITGDGRIALILDVPSMLKRYARRI